jgi:hypothetical protein
MELITYIILILGIIGSIFINTKLTNHLDKIIAAFLAFEGRFGKREVIRIPLPSMKDWLSIRNGFLSFLTLRPKAERWLVSLSFWIPRKFREAITGDILEDCHEMRELGFTERRIRVHVLWQFAWAVIALWPEAIGSAVVAIVKRIKIKQ